MNLHHVLPLAGIGAQAKAVRAGAPQPRVLYAVHQTLGIVTVNQSAPVRAATGVTAGVTAGALRLVLFVQVVLWGTVTTLQHAPTQAATGAITTAIQVLLLVLAVEALAVQPIAAHATANQRV